MVKLENIVRVETCILATISKNRSSKTKLEAQSVSVRNFNFVSLFLYAMFIGILVAGCQSRPGIQTPSATPTLTPTQTITPSPITVPAAQSDVQPTEEQVIATPTPAPTATPSPLDIAVDDIVESIGVKDLTILGLSGESLVNFLISALIVLLGSLAGGLLVDGVIWITSFTPTEYDNQILKLVQRQVKWLITLLLLEFATARLAFLSSGFKQWVDLLYFAMFVLVIGNILWKLIDFVLQGPLRQASSPKNRGLLITFTPLLRRTIQVVIVVVGLAIILQNFGVNLGALLAVLGLGGLAVSLAAKETLEDMINGFIILIDRPFQIGDRIKIETMDIWGDVEDIGSRTTRIRTLDNRLVIIPNSVIGRNQVENFTFPDPSFRIDVQVGIAYGSDIDQVLSIIEGAVLNVPAIMQTKPPLVEFIEFGDSAMIFRAIYWLQTYEDIRVRTEVNKAIYQALTEANIEMPYVTYDVNLAYKNRPEDNGGS